MFSPGGSFSPDLAAVSVLRLAYRGGVQELPAARLNPGLKACRIAARVNP
jgi:hypothetical protein